MGKRRFCVLLCVLMGTALLAGCSEDAAKELSSEEKTASVSQGDAREEKKEPVQKKFLDPVAKEDLRVGVVYMEDPARGAGYSYAHDQGIIGMQKSLGLSEEQIIRKSGLQESDTVAVEEAMLECIEEGCQIIFSTSAGYMDVCTKLAEEYPDVIFSQCAGTQSNGRNYNRYFGRVYQARYLSGIAAGLKTTSDKIGYVSAYGKTNPETCCGIDAFAMGVYSVNPKAQVLVSVTNAWYNPEAEKEAAEELIADGCDVIAQHCNSANPQIAAEEAGVYGIGYNSDMSKDAPNAVLCSVLWDWSVYYTQAAEQVMNGTWTCENYYGGMAEGIVSLSELSDLNEPEAADEIERVRTAILEGSFHIFEGMIETDKETTVGMNDTVFHDDIIRTGINWYFKTITEK